MHFYMYVPDHCVCVPAPQYISEEGGMEIWVHFSVRASACGEFLPQ